ncbi:MAG: Ig-like domain-containing protein [Bacteroidales bacterium]|nr:Ig-like domain-containing protein [Bacteroidales bacterium]
MEYHKIVGGLIAILTLLSCQKEPKTIAVTGITLSQTSVELTEGESTRITATISPSNATNKTVIWSSDNSYVTVSDGTITGTKPCTATVTAKSDDGGKTATCQVRVIARNVSVSGISLDKTELSMIEGDTQALTATVSPSNATNQSVTWTSNNESVATISYSGVVTAKSPGTATITVKTNDGGKTATCDVTVKAKVVSVTGVTLDKASLTLTEGETQTLVASVTPENATDKSLSWSSSNNSVATISSNGQITAVSAGTATITVKTNDGGKTATCAVTVMAKTVSVTGVSLNNTSLTMTEGETQSLVANVTPENATDKSLSWSSSNNSVATISSDGQVTAVSAGTATITVKTNDGGKTATCTVTVKAKVISVTGVSLDKYYLTLTEDETYNLTATVTPENATNKSVTWTSSNTTVATVSSNGLVTAKTPGSAEITVKTNDGGSTATCYITVKAKVIPVTGISLNTSSMTMKVGETKSLSATVTPSNATDKTVTWKSSDSSVATVDSNGKVTAKSAGSVTISATAGSFTANCSVTVVVPVESVSLNKTELTIEKGKNATLTATINPSNATDKTVTWKSSNTAIATVDQNGKVTAVEVGSAVITVTTNDGSKTATCSVTVKKSGNTETIIDDGNEHGWD